MKFSPILPRIALALFVFVSPAIAPAVSKPVLVHYMPWYVAKPYSTIWGYHWTMNHYNPDTFNTNGNRNIASQYYPLIGPYDSADPAALEYHVLLMKLGGVDGVIVDWYGTNNCPGLDYHLLNQRTASLFNYTRKAGLKFAICYEDRTIPALTNNGCLIASNALGHAQQLMLYLQATYFTNPSYLRRSNSPVLLNFGPQYFKSSANWVDIFSGLAATNQPAFFTEDNRLSPVATGAFDWPPMYLSGGGTLTTNQLNNYLNNFDNAGKTWPAFISSAFPRFNDIYAQAGTGSTMGYLDDRNGATFRETLRRAMTNSSAFVQVVTWNDYGEGTIVEPTKEFGYRDLGVIQDLRRQYMDASFPYHTNDAAQAFRFYNLRKQYGTSPSVAAELDRVFTNLVSGKLTTANLQMSGIESNTPVLYDLSSTGDQMQFSIGGYLAAGVAVRMSTNFTSWQTVKTFAAGTSLMTFATNFTQNTRSFFKVQVP